MKYINPKKRVALKIKPPRFRLFNECEAKRGEVYGFTTEQGPIFVVFLSKDGRIIAGLESPALAPVGTVFACFYTTR